MGSNDQLLTQVYDELRRLAAAKIAREQPGLTLTATALVHEAYLRIGRGQAFENRGHFYIAAAEAMRRILVEAARRRRTMKRGGDRQRDHYSVDLIATPDPDDDLIALHEALNQFAAIDPPKSDLVKLRYFGGLTSEEAADLLGISASTADRQWVFARAWLKRHLDADRQDHVAT